MGPARKYAEVAIRKAWADLLLRLRLRRLSAQAHDEAVLRASVLAEDFRPAVLDRSPVVAGALVSGIDVRQIQRDLSRHIRYNETGW